MNHVFLAESLGSIGDTSDTEFENWLANARRAMLLAGWQEADVYNRNTDCQRSLWTPDGEEIEGVLGNGVVAHYQDEQQRQNDIDLFQEFCDCALNLCTKLTDEELTPIVQLLSRAKKLSRA